MTVPSQTYDLEVSRLIRAPRAKVFAAFVDKQAAIMEHFAPNGPDGKPMRCVVHDMEPRVGGAMVYSMVGADDGPGHLIEGRFLEIVQDEKIVQSQRSPDGPGTTVTFLFRDADGGTQVTIRHEGLPDQGWAEGAKHGWGSALQNLAAAWEAVNP